MDIGKVIIGLAVGVYITAYIIPGAISAIVSSNTVGWGAGNIALWGLIPTILVIGIIVLYYRSTSE